MGKTTNKMFKTFKMPWPRQDKENILEKLPVFASHEKVRVMLGKHTSLLIQISAKRMSQV